MLPNNDLHKKATHEAGYFVVQIVGYKWDGEDHARGPVPEKLLYWIPLWLRIII